MGRQDCSSSVGEVLFDPGDVPEGSYRQADQQKPIRFTLTRGYLGASVDHAGKPTRGFRIHGWRDADLTGSRRERRRFADGCLAGGGGRAFHGLRSLRASSAGVGSRQNTHAPIAFSIGLDGAVRQRQ